MNASHDRGPLPNEPELAERRSFLYRAGTGLLGLVLGLVPALAGLAVVFDPLLKRKTEAEGEELKFLPITSVDAVPDDGVARLFPVIADLEDAWTFSPNERVGAVYLKRSQGSTDIIAFNAICPHAGCFVGFDESADEFKCPCHTSAFTSDGEAIKPSPSPRDMDRLTAKIENGNIMVAFANFIAGREEKTAKL